ncbi:DUF262 domain-containing protein [Desulforhabdus amnigena]|jgi:hypothetical protein|uniref:DUF262 domain-containing protein n=1 Tax=Desulforhabdus amnigena TaxID=40218 RepID=A0A9W6FVE4_9BACT|nr:DUF262 domain-containing HNH endonuclease family protein [Desulforhabdus amnigena]NLJ29927.1 DUF262 domain-containing protein [Deltaproteobacteria bacterium]GLI35537.1 hypothetical protein DAMNIGENAA_29700 [Desulforhabdus amnigena]
MEASTTIKQMLAGNRIFVPAYQRAYSWDTEFESSKAPKQVNTFLSDLEDYNRSSTKSKFYFGHFLFEEKSENEFGVIDGQQRLTTISIFLSALFLRLKAIRPLSEDEDESFEDLIKRKSTYRFATVGYDNQLFKDYVIDQIKKDKNGLETESAKRIVDAFDFFSQKLADKDEVYLLKMLETVQGSSCTTHPVTDESEAIQMFIFQNNRGKKPSNLEIIKAQFMFIVHLYGGDEKESLIEEIKSRFEKIYKSISSIEYNIDEDDVLVYTLRVHFNSLWESNAIEKINKLLSGENSISFIKLFTQSLAVSFEHLTTFFGKDEKENLEIHSLISLGGIAIAIPFIIKAYKFGLQQRQLSQLCSSLESLVIRHRLIGTRADITSRLNDVYQKFKEDNSDIRPIIDKIEWMKNVGSDSWWWAYWNNQALERALQGGINHSIAKFLLWKYETHLESQGKSGYSITRFDKIINPELEHIAPETENPETGYDTYDEEFVNQYINCLGNYLLISKSHNCSVGNKPFADKRASYKHSEQQREVQEMTKDNLNWTRSLIQERKEKIIKVLMDKC